MHQFCINLGTTAIIFGQTTFKSRKSQIVSSVYFTYLRNTHEAKAMQYVRKNRDVQINGLYYNCYNRSVKVYLIFTISNVYSVSNK